MECGGNENSQLHNETRKITEADQDQRKVNDNKNEPPKQNHKEGIEMNN